MKEEALELFDQGYNCCQSIVSVYGKYYGLSSEHALKIASTFGGGIGKSARFLCGTINGALMILGLAFSEKEVLRKKTKYFLAKLEANHKSLNCLDILRENNEKNSMHSGKCRNFLSEVCDALNDCLNLNETHEVL